MKQDSIDYGPKIRVCDVGGGQKRPLVGRGTMEGSEGGPTGQGRKEGLLGGKTAQQKRGGGLGGGR